MTDNIETEPPRRVHLGRLLKGYENLWVALDDRMDRVVAFGDSFAKAAEAAEKKGHESPIVIWSPPTMEGFEL